MRNGGIVLVLVQKKIYLFSGKSAKILQPSLFGQLCTKSFVGWALPQTSLGELTALSQTP